MYQDTLPIAAENALNKPQMAVAYYWIRSRTATLFRIRMMRSSPRNMVTSS